MTVKDAMEVLGARVLVGEEHLDREVRSACGSDMMSDVLAFSKDHSILLTGLLPLISPLHLLLSCSIPFLSYIIVSSADKNCFHSH